MRWNTARAPSATGKPGSTMAPLPRTTITELRPHTDYQVRVRALNDETASDWSPPGSGQTNNTAPVFANAGRHPQLSREHAAGREHRHAGSGRGPWTPDGDPLSYTLGWPGRSVVRHRVRDRTGCQNQGRRDLRPRGEGILRRGGVGDGPTRCQRNPCRDHPRHRRGREAGDAGGADGEGAGGIEHQPVGDLDGAGH